MDLTSFKALTFDCYGTLVDWETGLLEVLRPWVGNHGLQIDDEMLLEAYAEAEALCERATPHALYPHILFAVHRELAGRFGLPPSAQEAERLSASVGEWPAFADTTEALRELKKHYKLVVISNVDKASFTRTNSRLGVEFDSVVTAEQVGAYKPDVRIFHYALEHLRKDLEIGPDDVLHVAQSLYHDHLPAKTLRLQTAWINRRLGQEGWGATRPPSEEVKPDLEVGSLAEFASLVKKAFLAKG
ncbi:MAG: haloacid dehalogenase type II [Planctomycetota bacterium]|nr:MAG: haloacid dehalogenase type II [Planctomycetota bacterium]